MTREIKFRAWDNKNKKWLLGYDYPNLGGFNLTGETVSMGEWSRVLNDFLFQENDLTFNDLKIMQYTNLQDKNGVEIYEGDIIDEGYVGGEGKQVVKFGHWCNEQSYSDYRSGYGWYLDGMTEHGEITCSLHNSCIVIGNIYENPDLLE
jgi:uncharacterized phage protein (TIGR01671 family)